MKKAIAILFCLLASGALADSLGYWPSGSYLTVPGPATQGPGAAPLFGQILFTQVFIEQEASPSALSVNVYSSTMATDKVKMALYDSTAQSYGAPQSLIAIAGETTVPLTSSEITVDIPFLAKPSIKPGLYWVALMAESAAGAQSTIQIPTVLMQGIPAGISSSVLGGCDGPTLCAAMSYGAFPLLAPAGLTTACSALFVGVKR